MQSKHIGQNIAYIRILQGIKQSAFASALGITQQAVSKIKKSEHIDYGRLLHVAEVLGVSVETIKTFDKSKVLK